MQLFISNNNNARKSNKGRIIVQGFILCYEYFTNNCHSQKVYDSDTGNFVLIMLLSFNAQKQLLLHFILT